MLADRISNMTSKTVVLSSLTIAGILSIVAACTTPNEASQELNYSKDYRTDLCFASRHINTNVAVMTNVPCTSEVLRLIPKEVK